jgi:CubicO group peptidase (beta-lactamase class C family)
MIRTESVLRLTKFLDTWLSIRAEKQLAPGFSISVYQNGKPLYEQAFGLADAATGQPLSLNHRFNIGSQAKMLTAVLILQLAQAQRLHLDDPAARYLPWLTEHSDPRFQSFTIRQLLWHGAGLPREGQDAGYWLLERPFPSNSTIRRTVLAAQLSDHAGQRLKYSNLGYALLGQILEAVCGQSYTAVAQAQIIHPLGLRDTFVAQTSKQPETTNRIATGHVRLPGGKRATVPRNIAVNDFAAVCGWHSTPGDMARIMAALTDPANETLLPRHRQTLLLNGLRHHWQPPADRGTEYGLGIMRHTLRDREIVGHSGGFIGHLTCSYTDPAQQQTVVVMANSQDAPLTETAFGCFDVLHHYQQYDTGPLPADREVWNTGLENILAAKYIVALAGKIVSVPLDDWTPFDAAEELTMIDQTTLRISQAFDLLAEGELIRARLGRDGSITSVDYAGIPFSASAVRTHRLSSTSPAAIDILDA